MNRLDKLVEAIKKYINYLETVDITKINEFQFLEEFLKIYNINDIDISQAKVIFFSPYYNKYQIYSSDYQNIPFDLYKITKYEDDIVDIEKIEKTSKEKFNNEIFKELTKEDKNEIKVYTEEDHLSRASEALKETYEALKDKILELGDIDIDVKKVYIAFKGRRNIVDIEVMQKKLIVFINVKKDILNDQMNILSDISNIGHHGNGDYSIDIYKQDDIDMIIPFIKKSYEINKK